MITIRNITKSFGTLKVLKGIDLDINKGEIVSIVGPSGAGKTTLLQIMGTLDRPDTGSVCVDGIDTTTLSRREISNFRNRHLGFVFQFHQLLPEFTALENIMIPAFIAGTPNKEAKQRAKELLDFMGLTERASHKPNELSGGEKQRIAVARALVNNPEVILADEPSGSLDTQNKAELHQLFFDLRDRFGQTFVIVTHDESLASITDRTIHMRDGLLDLSDVKTRHPKRRAGQNQYSVSANIQKGDDNTLTKHNAALKVLEYLNQITNIVDLKFSESHRLIRAIAEDIHVTVKMATFLKGTIQNFNFTTLFRFNWQLGIINMNTTACSLNFLNNQWCIAHIGKRQRYGHAPPQCYNCQNQTLSLQIQY